MATPSSDQGIKEDRYKLIPRTLIFLTRAERILLLKGASHKRLWANLYNGIGGHIEKGEDVLTSARRELVEETGLHSSDLWLCATITIDTGENTGIGIFVFRGECPDGEPTPSTEGELEWVNIQSIPDLTLVEDLPVLLPKLLSRTKGGPPLAVHYSYNDLGNIQITFGE